MPEQRQNIIQYDPFEGWQTMRDLSIDTWSQMMIQWVNSAEYARVSSALLDTYLTSVAPFRQALEAAMAQTLAQLNMPTRADMIALAERLNNIELRLEELDARLDQKASI